MRFNVWQVILLLLLVAPSAEAQLWRGPAAVEVRVEDQKGFAVSGAHVRLLYKSVDPKEGPPPVTTDAKGRVNVSGLAEGPWSLEVSREGYMTFLAEIAVREGGRIQVSETAQLNVPGALRFMEVRVARGRREAGSRETVVAERTPAERMPAETPKEMPPAPAPEPQMAPPSAPAVAPAPEPAPPPPAAVPSPAPAPPTPQPDPVRLRTHKDRTCIECPPGESAISTERTVPHGSGSCGGDIASRLQGGAIPTDLPDGCHVLRIALPAGARYTGYRYDLQDGGDVRDCLAGRDCSGGGGRWPADPVLVRGPNGTVVLAAFESGAADRERRAVLTVYFSTGSVRRR